MRTTEDSHQHHVIPDDSFSIPYSGDITRRPTFEYDNSLSTSFEKHLDIMMSQKLQSCSHVKKELSEWRKSKEFMNSTTTKKTTANESCSKFTGLFNQNHKVKSRYHLSEGNLVEKLAKPKLVSLSQISRDNPSDYHEKMSQSSSTQFSPAKDRFSPGQSAWGSLDRSFKLRLFSLPCNKDNLTFTSMRLKNTSQSLPSSPLKNYWKKQERNKRDSYASLSLKPLTSKVLLDRNHYTVNQTPQTHQGKI